MARLELFLFGIPHLERDGVTIPIRRRKALALLAYLAVMPGLHARDTVAALLWPEVDATQARANLRRALVDLREAVGPDAFEVEAEHIALRSVALSVDVARFRACLARVAAHHHERAQPCDDCLAALAEAAGLYRDDFFAGFSLRDTDEFDTWQTYQSETLRLELAESLEMLAITCGDRGEVAAAIPFARRWLTLDPLCEPAHRCLMRLYAWSGDRAAAFVQYQACQAVLQRELRIAPEIETTALYEQLKAGGVGSRPGLAPSRASVVPAVALYPINNLPIPAGVFFGRDTELAQVSERFADPACRLLTLLGPGGVGKTRLAVEAGRSQLERFPHGVCFVSLVSVAAPDLIPSTILRALDAPAAGNLDPQRQLCDLLRGRQMLLILDNFEHLLVTPAGADSDRDNSAATSAALLSDLLADALSLKLLVTSRERLNLQAEWLLPLAGLDLPPDDDQFVATLSGEAEGELEPSGPPDLTASSAARFFLHCARRVRPVFRLGTDDARLVAHICRQIDGMPLAIELIAPWVRVLPLPEISRRLVQNLDLLASSLRDVSPRHRSMRAAFDSSWRLLTSRERALLRRCSVFRGGFSVEAAEAVADASLVDLAGLVDRSWIRVEPAGRYEMHELIHQYCAERLEAEHLNEAGERVEQVRERHDLYYVEQLDHWEQACRAAGSRSVANLPLVADLVNLEDTWLHAVGVTDLDRLYLMRPLMPLLYYSGRVRTVLRLLAPAAARLRELSGEVNSLSRQSQALVLLAWLHYHQCVCYEDTWQPELAYQCIEDGLAALARADRDAEGWDEANYSLREGLAEYCHEYTGDRAAAARVCQELLTSLERIHTKLWPYRPEITLAMRRASLESSLGMLMSWEGRYAEARQALEHALPLLQGEDRPLPLFLLSETLWSEGEYQRAKRLADEALRLSREVAPSRFTGIALFVLARAETTLGEVAEARRHFTQSAAVARSNNHPSGMAAALAGLGQIELNLGRAAKATEIYGEVLSLCEHYGRQNDMYSAVALVGLGQAAAAMHIFAEAKEYYRRALHVPARLGRTTMEAIAGVAQVMAMDGNSARATELLAFVVAHPYTPHWTRQEAEGLLAELTAELPAETYAVTTLRGQAWKLEDVVAEVTSAEPASPR